MKLYATTTSERASKGQGGNEYIHVDLKNEDNETVAKIAYTDSGISIMHTKQVYAELEQVNDLIQTKGKSQKGECNKNCKLKIGEHSMFCYCICHKKDNETCN